MKKLLLSIILQATAIILLASFGGNGDGSKYPSGSPAGYTNSPHDGKDCSNCHGGSSTAVTGWITSDVPVSGYVAGTNYTITVTVQGTGSEKKGFEVSPQKSDGSLLGTITAGSGSKITGTAYITHSAAKTTNPAVWTFTWTAPVAGTGSVTFYGAFVDGYSNIYHSTMTVDESSVGISNPEARTGLVISPNPVVNKLNYSWDLASAGHVVISVYDLTGKLVAIVLDSNQPAGMLNGSMDLSGKLRSGIYLVKYSDGMTAGAVKIVVN
jgi:hypothetical protein